MPPALARAVIGDRAAPPSKASGAGGRLAIGAPDATRLMVLAFALCAFVAAAFCPQMLWDADTLWHIMTGDWMLAHRQVVAADPFSYSMPGHPWVDLEWLSEVLMAPIYGLGGWSGVDLVFGLAIGVLTWILTSELARKLPPFSCAAAIFMALACTTQSWLARPHLIALPILALWTVQLLRAREAARAPPLWLWPVMVVWANLHGSFLFGLALTGPFALEALLDAQPEGRLEVVRGWGLFGAGALVASLITPHGLDGLIYPIRLVTMSTLPDVSEWQSENFTRFTPFEMSLLATLFILLYRGVKIPIVRLITLLGLLHLTLHETRHQMVLAVAGTLLLADPIGKALTGETPVIRLPRLSAVARYGILGAMAVVFAGAAAIRMAVPASLTNGPTAPIAAFAHVPEALRRQPVLNEYGFGGYLIFNHVPTFIDGRQDMYGDAFVDGFVKAKANAPRLEALLARYHVRWTILGADDPAVQLMDQFPGWKRLYADKWAVVHVKTGA